MDRLWTKFVNGNGQKIAKKVNQEQKKPVDTKEENKKFVAGVEAGAQEKKPLLEQTCEEDDDDDDSADDVFEDALSEVPREDGVAGAVVEEEEEKEDEEKEDEEEENEEEYLDEEEKELSFDVQHTQDTVSNDVYDQDVVCATAAVPLVQIPCGNIWSALVHSTKVNSKKHLNVWALGILKEPAKLSDRTTLLRFGQHVMLVTAYYMLADCNLVPAPFTTHMAISVSYTDHIMYPTCVNNGLVTAAAGIAPLARNVFRIQPANPEGAMHHIRFGQPIVLQLTKAASPIYLAGGSASDESYPVRLATSLQDRCHFKFISRLQEQGDNVEYYPVASHDTFLIQHVQSGLFLTFDSHHWASTIFGMENSLKLQPLEYFNKSIANKHLFKAFLN